MSDKVIRDGCVAVLYSPDFGAGWYTWNRNINVFDSEMVEAINDKGKLIEIAARNYPDAYLGGIDDLKIAWVPQGMRFTITEYDGAESVVILGPDDGLVA